MLKTFSKYLFIISSILILVACKDKNPYDCTLDEQILSFNDSIMDRDDFKKTPVTVGLIGKKFIQILSGIDESAIILHENPASDNPVVERGKINFHGNSNSGKKKSKKK